MLTVQQGANEPNFFDLCDNWRFTGKPGFSDQTPSLCYQYFSKVDPVIVFNKIGFVEICNKINLEASFLETRPY